MARQPQVTRTMKTTVATVLCVNVTTGETFNKDVTLPRTYRDEAKMMKLIENIVNDGNIKAVYVVNQRVEETLYGMSEIEFINAAHILPPRKSEKN